MDGSDRVGEGEGVTSKYKRCKAISEVLSYTLLCDGLFN